MSGPTNATSTNGTPTQSQQGRELTKMVLLDLELARERVMAGWNELACAVLAVLIDVVVIAAGVHFFRNGLIPTWLDTYGQWAWFGAGAVAGLFALAELPNALSRFNRAFWWLWIAYRTDVVVVDGTSR